MKEALKGIEVELVRLAEQREDKEADYEQRREALSAEFERSVDSIDRQAGALEEARRVLLNVNGNEPVIPPDPQPEELDRLANRAKKSPATVKAADLMMAYLRNNGASGLTAMELGEAVSLSGRGSGPVRDAAVRLLVAEGKLIEANHTSDDGSPLYTLTANNV